MPQLVHWEIPSTDPAASAQFYQQLFGWPYSEDPAMPGYVMVKTGENSGGGICNDFTPNSHVTGLYFDAPIAETLQKAESLGAKVVTPRTAIADGKHGYFAQIEDPYGAIVGVWEMGQ
ncbi:MAG TPA: VOC family protein [bacterium]|nr:VOC family protein [bacterium]